MPNITDLIPQNSYELVRDRIAEILADELPNQATLAGESYINANVFTERTIPIQQTETSLVEVSLARGDYDLMTAINKDGTYTYHIDIFTKSKSNENIRAGELASRRLQRLTGICSIILSHWKYRTLGFMAPFIEHTEVQQIQFAKVDKNNDAATVVMSRITFNVRVPESISKDNPTLIAGYETSVKISDTDFGYKYQTDI